MTPSNRPFRAAVMAVTFALLLALPLAMAGEAEKSAQASGPRVHIAEGMWSQHWRLPEALKEKYTLSESFLTSRYGFVTALKGFPMKKEDLFANQGLILANIPVDAFKHGGTWSQIQDVPGRSDAWVEEFLAQGGGVFILGGNYSFGAGGNFANGPSGNLAGTQFEKFLPVITHNGDIPFDNQNKPVQLTPAGKHPILEGVDWSGMPVTLFYHEVAAKPGAEVLVKAGEAPILIAGTYRGGRIVVWTATLHGEPPDPAKAYWRWASWNRLAQNITQWITGLLPPN